MSQQRCRTAFERLELRLPLTAELVPLGTFGLIERIPIVPKGSATAALIDDFNLDGITDLAFGSSNRRDQLDERNSVVGIALGDGEGGYALGAEPDVHDDVISLIAADLNQDGFLDIVAGGIY